MADSIRQLLARSRVLDQVVVTTEVDQLLTALEVTGPRFDFALTLPDPGLTLPFKLKLDPAASPASFWFWLQLADEQHALAAFTFVRGSRALP